MDALGPADVACIQVCRCCCVLLLQAHVSSAICCTHPLVQQGCVDRAISAPAQDAVGVGEHWVGATCGAGGRNRSTWLVCPAGEAAALQAGEVSEALAASRQVPISGPACSGTRTAAPEQRQLTGALLGRCGRLQSRLLGDLTPFWLEAWPCLMEPGVAQGAERGGSRKAAAAVAARLRQQHCCSSGRCSAGVFLPPTHSPPRQSKPGCWQTAGGRPECASWCRCAREQAKSTGGR